MRSDHEITSQIPRAELAGLLNTMTPFDEQRVTAEITAPAEMLTVPTVNRVLPPWVIIAVSCLVTLLLGGLVMLAA